MKTTEKFKTAAILLAAPFVWLSSILFMVAILAITMGGTLFKRERYRRPITRKQPFEKWESSRRFLKMSEVSDCGACNHLVRESFPSEQDFEDVDLKIQRGFSHQQTIPGGFSKPKHEFLGIGIGGRTFFGAQIYTCEKCNKEWELSSPDMAYRGYFKPIEYGNRLDDQVRFTS